MATMLITEALQQVKILAERIQKKRKFVEGNVTSNSRFIDPLKKDGGSDKVIASELQAIGDLEQNLVNVRTAIQKKNLESYLTFEGTTRTVAEWLIWRREISGGQQVFFAQLASKIVTTRAAHERAQQSAPQTPEGQAVKESNINVHMSETALAKDTESLGIILGTLDAKLSIFNATTMVEI
jgi:hypothetical protein